MFNIVLCQMHAFCMESKQHRVEQSELKTYHECTVFVQQRTIVDIIYVFAIIYTSVTLLLQFDVFFICNY